MPSQSPHVEPSPSHSPQSSFINEPPQVPAQSVETSSQQPSAFKPEVSVHEQAAATPLPSH